VRVGRGTNRAKISKKRSVFARVLVFSPVRMAGQTACPEVLANATPASTTLIIPAAFFVAIASKHA